MSKPVDVQRNRRDPQLLPTRDLSLATHVNGPKNIELGTDIDTVRTMTYTIVEDSQQRIGLVERLVD